MRLLASLGAVASYQLLASAQITVFPAPFNGIVTQGSAVGTGPDGTTFVLEGSTSGLGAFTDTLIENSVMASEFVVFEDGAGGTLHVFCTIFPAGAAPTSVGGGGGATAGGTTSFTAAPVASSAGVKRQGAQSSAICNEVLNGQGFGTTFADTFALLLTTVPPSGTGLPASTFTQQTFGPSGTGGAASLLPPQLPTTASPGTTPAPVTSPSSSGSAPSSSSTSGIGLTNAARTTAARAAGALLSIPLLAAYWMT